MKRVLLLSLLLVAVQLSQCRRSYGYKQELRQRNHLFFSEAQNCIQDEPDCEKCLSSSGNCEWCSDGGQRRAECTKRGSEKCPREYRRTNCESQSAEDENKGKISTEYNDRSLDELSKMNAPPMNASIVTVNASVLCGRQGGCNNCTANDFCFWCESMGECQVHYNATTRRRSCPNMNTAYRDQCIYPIGVTPCYKRKSSCEHCLEDGLCYWCTSTKACGFYPGGDFKPNDCPMDKMYHEDCHGAIGLFWVLFPILAIILIPIIIYLITWLICCCMRAAGYEPLEPAESDPAKKQPKGIRLKPGTPSNKTDELRKKYDLDNP